MKAPWLEVSEKYKSTLPPINEDVLCLETLVHWQRNLSAKRFLRERGEQIAGAVLRKKGGLVWPKRQKVWVYREVGNIRTYTLSAWSITRDAKKHGIWSEDSVHVRFELVSSPQMRIPNFDTSRVKYARSEATLMTLLALVTEAAFWILRLRVIGRRRLTGDSDVAGISAAGELENRHLALEFRTVDAFPVSAQRKRRLRELLEKRLLTLGDVAQKKGLHATVKGVIRRIHKIGHAKIAQKDAGGEGLAEVARDDADREVLVKDALGGTIIPADAISKGLAGAATADDAGKGLEAFYEMYAVF